MLFFILYCIGAIFALGLLYAALDPGNKNDVWIIIVGTLLSWITVVLMMYELDAEAIRNRKNPLP